MSNKQIDPIGLGAVKKYNNEGLQEFANNQAIQAWQLKQLQDIGGGMTGDSAK